jgi:hypothetical protein
VDRTLVCNTILSGNLFPVAGLAGRFGSSCDRPATHDPVFEALLSLGKPAARSDKPWNAQDDRTQMD